MNKQLITTNITVAFFAIIVIVSGILLSPLILRDRLMPGVYLASHSLAGLNSRDIPKALNHIDQGLRQKTVQIALRNLQVSHTLSELGVSLDVAKTTGEINQIKSSKTISLRPIVVNPHFLINTSDINNQIRHDFNDVLQLPINSTLSLTPTGIIQSSSSSPGENVDLITFEQDLQYAAIHQHWLSPISLNVITAPAEIQNNETEAAKNIAQKLLTSGLVLTASGQDHHIPLRTIQSLLTFSEQVDPNNSSNIILGVSLDPAGLEKYLETYLAPQLNQPPQNARFEMRNNIPQQITAAIPGRSINLGRSTVAVNQAASGGNNHVELVVDQTQPAVAGDNTLSVDRFKTMLARGESDFVGSPANRIHNIVVGTARYHGLLISPGEEFSFNDFLGPVTAAAGYKPELVIKHDKTIPEYGGGLCQVSTTVFRAAAYAGLNITERRNHAYAVSYYGTPGFDATIYPGSSDLRFLNDTGDYVLIQAYIQGTKLIVELWGEDDGREVALTGPNPYDRQPDGSVKATLNRTVTKNGETLYDDTFYSRYKSPALFPKVPAT